HGSNGAAPQIDAERRKILDAGGFEAMRWLDLVIQSPIGGPGIDAVEKPIHLEIGQRALIAERARELRLAIGDARQASGETDPDAGQPIEIDGSPIEGTGQLERRYVSRAPDVVDLVEPIVEHPRGIHPPF